MDSLPRYFGRVRLAHEHRGLDALYLKVTLSWIVVFLIFITMESDYPENERISQVHFPDMQ
jgi:hypothetical protein